MLTEAQLTGQVLMVGSEAEVKLLKEFCKLAGVKVFSSKRVMPGYPQLWFSVSKP